MQRPRQSDQLISVNNARRVRITIIFCSKNTNIVSTFCKPIRARICVVCLCGASASILWFISCKFQIYSLDDAECSELCFCTDSLVLTCHALCVPIAPCRTALAFYSHASPAYQAFRGRCLCYSGKFICMRPPPGEYILPGMYCVQRQFNPNFDSPIEIYGATKELTMT